MLAEEKLLMRIIKGDEARLPIARKG